MGVPVKCMVGKASKDAKDVLKVLNKTVDKKNLVVEFKYDGERTQIHYQHDRDEGSRV